MFSELFSALSNVRSVACLAISLCRVCAIASAVCLSLSSLLLFCFGFSVVWLVRGLIISLAELFFLSPVFLHRFLLCLCCFQTACSSFVGAQLASVSYTHLTLPTKA